VKKGALLVNQKVEIPGPRPRKPPQRGETKNWWWGLNPLLKEKIWGKGIS